MSVAMYAAPNPLSIFTTDTLGLHEFNMPSRSRTAPKACTIPNRRRDCNDGNANQASDHRGQSSLHARTDDDGVRFTKLIVYSQQAMQTRDPDVIQPRNAHTTKGFGGDRCLFGDR